MGLQGRLEDEVWDKLTQLSAPPRPAPQREKPVAPKLREKDDQRHKNRRAPSPASSRTPSTLPVQAAEHVEFVRRLSELRGLLRAMLSGNPVNGVTPGITSARLREACALANWLLGRTGRGSRKEQVELRRLVLQVNLMVRRYPALLSPPSSEPPARVVPVTREWRPVDVSKILIGPESSRWFMDPVNSK